MAVIKLGDSYLYKEELKDVIQLIQLKREILRTIKVNRTIHYIKFLRNNLKIKKE